MAAMARHNIVPGRPVRKIPKNGITPWPATGMISITGTETINHKQKPNTGSGQASVQRLTGSRISHVVFTSRLL